MANWFENLFGFERAIVPTTKLDVVGTTLRSRVNQRSSDSRVANSVIEGTARRSSERHGRTSWQAQNLQHFRRREEPMVVQHIVTRCFRLRHSSIYWRWSGRTSVPKTASLDTSMITPRGRPARSPRAPPPLRNYFVPVAGQNGQTWDRQIDCLQDLGTELGNESHDLWTMRNGYALCTERGLATIAQRLGALDAHGIDALRDVIRIVTHSGVQVTDVQDAQLVSQAFC